MPLPAGGSKVPWPPESLTKPYRHFREYAAWYSGDPAQLAAVYYGVAAIDQYMGQPDRSTMDKPSVWESFKRNFFWSRVGTSLPYQRVRLHVPLASAIAATSAHLLFAEPVAIEIPEAHKLGAPRKAKASQDRLNDLVELCGLRQLFLEAAETASALGGVYLKVDWDRGFADYPVVTTVNSDAAVPEFKWGILQAVTFWRVVLDDGGTIWRLLERREPGFIINGLYKGSRDTLGDNVPLTELEETASLATTGWSGDALSAPAAGVIPTPSKRLTAVYVPNQLPNRLDRGSSLGRSDYQGIEGLLDALDETFSSLMRDLRLARARVMIPEEYLQAQGKGKGATFDLDEEIFTKLPGMLPGDGEIELIQPAIRVADHQKLVRELVERAVATAGYSAATFGIAGETQVRTVTATEVLARERQSLITRERKVYYWRKPLADIMQVLLEIDSVVFGQPEPQTAVVTFPDAAPVDPAVMANTVKLLAEAEAISPASKVLMVNPEWSPDQVSAEVLAIQAMPRPAGSPAFSPPTPSEPAQPGEPPEPTEPPA